MCSSHTAQHPSPCHFKFMLAVRRPRASRDGGAECNKSEMFFILIWKTWR